MRAALCGVVLALALGLGAPAAAFAADPDLAGEWHLDSIAGGTTPDSSGHNETATVTGSPVAVPDGRFAQAVRFPAKTDVVDAGNIATLQPRNVSLLAWVRSSSVPSTVKTIAAQGAAGQCSHASYALYMGGSTQAAGVRFYIWNGTNAYVTPPAPNSIWDGNWHAIAGTYDGSTVRLYVDGQEVGNTPASGPIGYGLDASNDLTIGNYAGASSCLEQTQFSGDIDEVRVYDRAITAAEVAYLSRSSLTTPAELPIPGSTPPPPPASVPKNTGAPTISQLFSAGGPVGIYLCNPGTWQNLPSPPGFGYRWVAIENGNPVPVGNGQQFTPSPDVYGYPVTCEVTVQGPNGTVRATSNSVFFTSAGLNTLPPSYGDVQVRGIDVFQIVQPNSDAQAYGYPSGAFGETCSGGTPTAFQPGTPNNPFLCSVGTKDPQDAMQHANYEGVTLDSDKSTTALVYVNMFNHAPGDPNLKINVELSGTLNGQSLGDPLVAPAPSPLQNALIPFVSTPERADGAYFVQFHLPAAWTAPGTLKLTAHVLFPKPDFGPSYGAHQCPDPTDPPGGDPTNGLFPLPNCDTDDTFTLDGIPTKSFANAPRFQAVQLLVNGQLPFSITPDQVMAAAKYLYPGGEHISFGTYSPYSINIDAASQVTVDSKGNCVGTSGSPGTGAQATRVCRWYAIDALMQQWVIDNPARLDFCGLFCVRLRIYDAVLGVSNYDSGGGILGCSAGSFCPEPGYQHPVGNDITKVSALGPSPSDTGWLIVNTKVHPVQGSAHELGHWLTLPHAGSNTGPCNSQPVFETWPGDDAGRLQGARFNPLKGYRAVPQVDGTPSDRKLYDLMSYCADFKDKSLTKSQMRVGEHPAFYAGDAWLSARNWNRVASVLDSFATRIGRGSIRVSRDAADATAAKARKFGFAVGVAGANGGGITRVVPPDGQDAIPASVPSSPYRLRSLGAHGNVLLDAGLAIDFPQEVRAAEGTFAGPVAPNATAVELIYSGKVLARRDRTRPPHVKLISPRPGIRVGRGQHLRVRWRASDPDSALQVMVDYSVNGGKIWRTAYTGPSTGHATLPASVLAGSNKARVRVTVNDGFSDATATSGAFKTAGNPPQVEIIAPTAGGMVLAGERSRLSGAGFDDQGQPLKGRALTWFAGRKRLGTGATLKARLPAGNVTLRLLAHSSNGLTRIASERLTVAAQRLRVVSLSVPQRVRKGARTVTLALRTSARARLTAAGHRFVVRTKATKITVALPKKPAVGVVKVPFTLSSADRSVKGTIRGSIWVVRT